MQVVYERFGALDVHKKTVAVRIITLEGKETRPTGRWRGHWLPWWSGQDCPLP